MVSLQRLLSRRPGLTFPQCEELAKRRIARAIRSLSVEENIRYDASFALGYLMLAVKRLPRY